MKKEESGDRLGFMFLLSLGCVFLDLMEEIWLQLFYISHPYSIKSEVRKDKFYSF